MTGDVGADEAGDVTVEIVEDSRGYEKRMIGRPAGLQDFDIPTGEADLDWRCPACGQVGFFRRTGYSNPSCTNRACRVDRFSPHVRDSESDENRTELEVRG